MRMGLEDKVVVVTGAASGIGAAIAHLLGSEGVGALVLTDRDGPGCQATADRLAMVPTLCVTADLSDPAAPAAIAEAARTQPLGRLVRAPEAANLAVFLLGDASVPMSGSIVDFEQSVAGAP